MDTRLRFGGRSRHATTPRGSMLVTLLHLVALLLLPLACSAPSEPAGAELLVARFPDRAPRVLDAARAFLATPEGFRVAARPDEPATDPEGRALLGRERLDLVLPRSAGDGVRVRLPDGSSATVREHGLQGRGELEGRTVCYAREDGSSFWSAGADGYEEWLHVGAGVVRRDRPVARWTVEGAALRPSAEGVELLDAEGRPTVRVSAPAAYDTRGAEVGVRLTVSGATIALWVDAEGDELLIDPVWKPAASMLSPRAYHTATLLQNGKVLVTGWGLGSELYDPVTDSWSAAAPTLAYRELHRATLLADGRVLVTGGFDEVTSAEVYDPTTNTWAMAGTMAAPRFGHCATRLADGRVLVVGGSTPIFYENATLAELYDPLTNSWSPAGLTTGVKRFCDAALLDDGRVLVVGGSLGATLPPGDDLPQTIEIYDPATNSWSPAAPMATPRVLATVTKLGSGKVLVAGGALAAPFDTLPPDESWWWWDGPTPDAELYDPATNTWSPTGSMSAPMTDHTATLLPSGRVLVTGGTWGPVQLAEQYDPATNTWSPAGWLLYPTDSFSWFGPTHTATRLDNGSVLLTGGFYGSTILSSTELFNPTCAVHAGFALPHQAGLCPQAGAPFCQAFCASLGCGVKYALPVCQDLPSWGNPPIGEHSFTEYCGCSALPSAPTPPRTTCPPPKQSTGPERAGAICPADDTVDADPNAPSFADACRAHCEAQGPAAAACAAHNTPSCASNVAQGTHRWTDMCVCTPCPEGFTGPSCSVPPAACPCGNLHEGLAAAGAPVFPNQCVYDDKEAYAFVVGAPLEIHAVRAGFDPETGDYHCSTANRCDIGCDLDRHVITAEEATACQQQIRSWGGPDCTLGPLPTLAFEGVECLPSSPSNPPCPL